MVFLIPQPQQFTDNPLLLLFLLDNGITCRKEGAGVQEIEPCEFTHNGTNAWITAKVCKDLCHCQVLFLFLYNLFYPLFKIGSKNPWSLFEMPFWRFIPWTINLEPYVTVNHEPFTINHKLPQITREGHCLGMRQSPSWPPKTCKSSSDALIPATLLTRFILFGCKYTN